MLLIALLVLLLYALPLLELPILSTPDTDFGAVLFTVASYVLVALGLNIVLGYAGLLDLGYVGFYAVGAYTVAVLGVLPGAAVLVGAHPHRGRRRDDLRHPAGRADPAGPRRLPRHRDARVRRDHPPDGAQLRVAG